MNDETEIQLKFKEGENEYDSRTYYGAVPIPKVGDRLRLWAGINHQMMDYVYGKVIEMEFDLVSTDEIVITYEIERFKG